jgi:transposase
MSCFLYFFMYYISLMAQQGKAISFEQKQCIVTLKKSFDLERKIGPSVSTKDSIGRIARGLDIGRRTVENIVSEYNKNGQELIKVPTKTRGKPPLKVSGDLIPYIRQHIRSENLKGQHVSVRNVRSWLLKEFNADIPVMTLWRSLQRVGFVYGENKRRCALKEKEYVLTARRKYLRKKIANRKVDGALIRPEVYLDETFLNKNHSNNKTWYLLEDGEWVNKPSGKGPRLIIVNAITKDGWVDGAKLVFQAKTGTGDYHGQMNYENFFKWFVEQLLPNIPRNSIIIMDNAKYHNILSDETFPTPRSYKHELQSWLKKNYPELGLHNDKSMLKPELYEICKKMAPPPVFKIDQVAEKLGHKILRTPQYHCELQPIESCWGVVKNYCRDHCEFTMKSLYKHLEIGFSKVTKATCQKIIKKVWLQEELFWAEDTEADELETINDEYTSLSENYIDFSDEVYLH